MICNKARKTKQKKRENNNRVKFIFIVDLEKKEYGMTMSLFSYK